MCTCITTVGLSCGLASRQEGIGEEDAFPPAQVCVWGMHKKEGWKNGSRLPEIIHKGAPIQCQLQLASLTHHRKTGKQQLWKNKSYRFYDGNVIFTADNTFSALCKELRDEAAMWL